MLIEIENFGIIKNVKFDFDKDLTLIFGKNNTGKSYAISVIYLMIKNLLNFDERYLYRSSSIEEIVEKISSKVQDKILSTDAKDINIKQDVEKGLSKILEHIFLESLEESFKNTYDSIKTLSNQLSKVPFSIKLTTDLLVFTISVEDSKLIIKDLQLIMNKIFVRPSTKNLNNKLKDGNIIIYTSNNNDIFKKNIFRYLFDTSIYIKIEVMKRIQNIYYLPASRSGLYQALSAFGQIIAELSKSRKFTSKRIELPSISEPLSDYFIGLSNIQKKNMKQKTNTILAAERIEKNILHGKVDFDKNTQKLIFTPQNTELKLDLSYTSSMVSEITPIVSYLRYIINQEEDFLHYSFPYKRRIGFKRENSKPIIIIEEPEAHLHPEIQIKLIEEFVQLAKEDVKFIITTHSNYIFNKFNNLVLSQDINTENTSALYFEETELGSVSNSLEINRFGSKDVNFSTASEFLYQERVDLIDKFNRE